MSTSPATIRQRMAAALEALSGWSESPMHADLFSVRDLGEASHQRFAVSLGATTSDQQPTRQKSRSLCTTVLRVRWGYVVRLDAQVTDTDAAVAAELTAAAAVRAMDTTDVGSPRLLSVSRRLVNAQPSPLLDTTQEWSVRHFYALS